jgi:hypothetical protein
MSRAVTLERQRFMLALLELGAEIGSAPIEVLDSHREELRRMRASIDNLRLVVEHERIKWRGRCLDSGGASTAAVKPL